MNNSSTSSYVGWAEEPEGRGTIGLLWSCFATIFLCTWSAIHPNLPKANASQGHVLLRRMGYMVMALVAPELLSLLALQDLRKARLVQKRSPNWPLKKCFFLSMGGFAIQREDEARQKNFRLNPEGFLRAVDAGSLDWPVIHVSDIDDRSKADWLVKSIAIIQVMWFVAQIIGRAMQRLPTTTLELFTLGIVTCAASTYCIWWEKPYDVRTSILMETKARLPANAYPQDKVELAIDGDDIRKMFPLFIVITSAFGAIHIVGWSFHFSTVVEKWLWRVCSIGCIILPIVTLVLVMLDNAAPATNKWWEYLIYLVLFVYPMLRLYMFVEMFVGLRSVPSGVYKTPQWSQYLPSFG